MTSKKVTRKWESFAGRNKFLCNGRLMTAPHNRIFYLTVLLITSTSILFFIFDCPFLAERITFAIPCIGAILFVFTMGSLLRTSFSDPGIIPRAAHDEARYIEKQIEVPNSCNSPTLRPPPRTKEVFVRGQSVKLKYCYTCKIFRPPRASHCSLCDNCVDRFDHHCPWVGNCVGKRNYRFFYMFIVSLAFLAVFIFACAITHLILLARDPPSRALLDALRASPTSAVVCAICFLSVWSVLGMAGFHTYLITTDQTTNEDIKGSFSSKRGQDSPNPYSRGGVCSNCWHVLCGPAAPSLIDRRGIVTEEFRLEDAKENRSTVIATPPTSIRPMYSEHPSPMSPDEIMEPVGAYVRPHNGSYTNLYRVDERDGEMEIPEKVPPQIEGRVDSSRLKDPRGMAAPDGKERHLYSNLADSGYMNHNLDLDPVVLTGSKENLVSNREVRQHMEMLHKSPQLKPSADPSCPNVSYKRERESVTMSDELNHNMRTPQKTNSAEPGAGSNHTQTWADRLPRADNRVNNNNNGSVTVLSASRLRLLHDTTMIDTALDLDSLDGSTVSLWPATV